MITEYTVTYWRHGEDLSIYFATVCAKDKTEAAKLFNQFYKDCEIISIRRVVPERIKPAKPKKRGLLARLFGRCA